MFTVVPLTDYLVRRGLDRFFMILPLAAAALSFSLALRLRPARFQGSPGQDQPMEWGTYGDLFRETPAGKIVFSCFFFGLCDASIVFIGTVLLEKGLIPSWFIFSLGAGALFVRTAGRNLFNRYQRTVFAGPSFLVMALCLLGLAFADSSLGLVFWGFCYGMGMGYGYPAHLALTADLAAPRLRAKASALVHFSMDLSWFILPLYMGFGCTLLGTRQAFLLFTLICIATAVMTTVMWLPGKKGRV
jgi:MFS family permease